jgi:NDP-sugar pyrophosphorylase family protein
MKVFVYESDNGVINFFQRPEFQIPFLSSNLLSFMGAGVVRNSILLDEDYQIFLPHSWEPHLENSSNFNFYSGDVFNQLSQYQKREYELVFVTGLFSLMLGDFFDHDLSHLKQNPEKFFSNRGVIGGYLKRGQELPVPEEFEGFKNFVVLSGENYLKLTQDLVENLSIKSVEVSARTYGKPIVLSEDVASNSTVCGPCFIGKGVRIEDSYIAPGTVILGNTDIINSQIMSSFIMDSYVDSSSMKDAMAADATIEKINLSQGAKLPPGSVIIGERKI